jgi:transcriptional regulator with PAS, ATPase and Fis domain
MPETLLESELFGHRRGAFTGAIRDQPGLFRAATGGTVFLDEVGEMPAPMQAKLLRVLEEGEVLALGESLPTKVDVRVLSATNRELRSDLQQGRFRSDLFYRIAVFPIELPPLRKRREDIPILLQRFVRRAAERQHKFVSGFDEAALAVLASYDWPGNIRELQNEVERAVALARDEGLLTLQHVSGSIRDATTSAVSPESTSAALSPAAVLGQVPPEIGPANGAPKLREARAVFEARFITDALTRCDGNISRAAKLMGLSRVQLQRKIKEYGLRDV